MSDIRYFEDMTVGERHRYGSYPVTADEIVEFATAYDPQPFHLDEAAARVTHFGGLVASGWHTAAMLMRMVADHVVPASATMGASGFDDLKWLRPVRAGDVLSVESEVLEKLPHPVRSDRGMIRIANRVVDQKGETLMSVETLVLFRRRPAA